MAKLQKTAGGKSDKGAKLRGISLVDRPIKHIWPICTMAWAPDGAKLLTGDRSGGLRVWLPFSNLKASGPADILSVVDEQSGGRRLRCAAWSPEGNQLVCGMEDGSVRHVD